MNESENASNTSNTTANPHAVDDTLTVHEDGAVKNAPVSLRLWGEERTENTSSPVVDHRFVRELRRGLDRADVLERLAPSVNSRIARKFAKTFSFTLPVVATPRAFPPAWTHCLECAHLLVPAQDALHEQGLCANCAPPSPYESAPPVFGEHGVVDLVRGRAARWARRAETSARLVRVNDFFASLALRGPAGLGLVVVYAAACHPDLTLATSCVTLVLAVAIAWRASLAEERSARLAEQLRVAQRLVELYRGLVARLDSREPSVVGEVFRESQRLEEASR